jgi:hypothetical protein
MAQISDPHSTPIPDDNDSDEWLLLVDVLALTASHCKSPDAAKQLIIETANDGRFPHWTYHHRAAGSNHQAIAPYYWGRSIRNAHYLVAWDISSIFYIRRDARPGSLDEVLEELLSDFIPADKFIQMRLVRLLRRDVLAMLKRTGLPVGSAAVAPTPTPTPTSTPTSTSSTSTSSTSTSTPVSTTLAKDPPPRGGTEQWVYSEMEADRPREGDQKYVKRLWERRKDKTITRKTIGNLVGKYRKKFEVPAEASEVPAGKRKPARKR